MRIVLISLLSFTLAGSAHAASTKIDPEVMRIQVLLDRAGFSPGVIDGRSGWSFSAALKGFQQAHGLKDTGTINPETKALFDQSQIEPVRSLTLIDEDFAGPFIKSIPASPAEQAKLPSLGYTSPIERLAEKFHTTPQTIADLNPGAKFAAGVALRLPNVLPESRAYPEKLKPEWRQTLSDLNVDANEPQAKRIVVSKSDKVLRVYDESDKLVAQFPATMGSSHDPLPIGEWKILGASYNPTFHYNPKLFWDAGAKDTKAKLPVGPNGPVGVVWLDLDKPHYGIHGTPNPEKIGRSESHGCIRLTNWDAVRLSMMVRPGTPATFQP